MPTKQSGACVRCGAVGQYEARKMCRPCYRDEWRFGTIRAELGPIKERVPRAPSRRPPPRHVTLPNPDMYRFWDKVSFGDGCWEWQGTLSTHGYGMFSYLRSNYLAHRVAYELTRGEIPDDQEIDHLCRNRRCVNPAHLEAVTHRVNVQRGDLPAITRQRMAELSRAQNAE